jgi:hypothetical protein
MLIIQYNCRKAYAITIAALETGLKRNAAFVCLQEPYIGQKPISHPGYILVTGGLGAKRQARTGTPAVPIQFAQRVFKVGSEGSGSWHPDPPDPRDQRDQRDQSLSPQIHQIPGFHSSI